MKARIHSDVYVGVCLEAMCAFFYFYGRNLPDSARMFPNILLLLVAVLSVFVIIEGIQKTKKAAAGDASADISWKELKYPLLTFLVAVAYYFLFRYAGYFIATPILLVGLMLLFRVRNWKVLVFVPVGYLVFTYVLFVWQLGVRLM